ncbi:MAG: hypothetical protein R3192_08550 [Woeseiaceae bacterium]|nr:hypothetical protein [Woeseiaceae bacterium]
MDEHIIGVGGVFLRAEKKQALQDWYANSLDVSINDYGGHDFMWRRADNADLFGRTVLGFFDPDSDYFEGPFMVNYVVRDLDRLLASLSERGIDEVKPREDYPYGRFAWIKDLEGRWIELWEPVYDAEENQPPGDQG